jgi:hypothetical protein
LLFVIIFHGSSYNSRLVAQTIIGGKIWSGEDTVRLGVNKEPDSLSSFAEDTVKFEQPAAEIDWASGDVIELPTKEISSKTNLLKLELSIPPGLKLIRGVPIGLSVKSSDPRVLKIGEGEGRDSGKPLVIPLMANPGRANLFLYYKVICDSTGTEGIRFLREEKLKIPVVVGDYDNDVLDINREIGR